MMNIEKAVADLNTMIREWNLMFEDEPDDSLYTLGLRHAIDVITENYDALPPTIADRLRDENDVTSEEGPGEEDGNGGSE